MSKGRPSAAGLLDRANLFASLANLAGSLCAHVVAGRPCDLLAPKHNRNAQLNNSEVKLNCSISHWHNRYINLSFSDGDPVLRGRRAIPPPLRSVAADARFTGGSVGACAATPPPIAIGAGIGGRRARRAAHLDPSVRVARLRLAGLGGGGSR